MKNHPEEDKVNSFSSIDEQIERLLVDWKSPGCALAVIKDGEVILSRGYGYRDVEQQLPVDEETVFAIGSTSKAFTAVTAAILVDQGLLEWDTPVRSYMPDFDLWDSFAAERMTVRDLLSHRSGLPRYDGVWYGSGFSRKELVQRLRHLKPNTDFRTTFQYQNLMFTAAGYLVEKLSGQTWESFTQQNILDPLGMKRTSLEVEGIRSSENAARGYAANEKGFNQLSYCCLDNISPAGGVNSCLADLVKWLKIHLNDGEFNGQQIVSPENLAQTHTPTTFIEGTYNRVLSVFSEIGPESYALGWFVHDYRGHRLLRHGGHIDGFSTQISFMPDMGAGVIVLSNIGGSSFMFAPTFLVYDLLLGLPVLNWTERIQCEERKVIKAGADAAQWYQKQRKKKSRPAHPLVEYAGNYSHPAYGTIEITLETDRLMARHNQQKVSLTHYLNEVFEWNTGSPQNAYMRVQFQEDRLGNVCSLAIPFELTVDAILFSRMPDLSLSEESVLNQYVGEYVWDGKRVAVLLLGDSLRLNFPGFPPMKLCACREHFFRVEGQPEWYVEFCMGKTPGLILIQPFLLFTVKKVKRH